MDKIFHFAYVTDNNYAMPTYISIQSLITNKKDCIKYYVHILGDRVEKYHKENLKKLNGKNVKIDYIDVDESFYTKMIGKSTRKNTYITESAMIKFDLPNLLKDVDILLYLDSDTIICSEVNELFDMKMDMYYVAAVVCNQEKTVVKTNNYFNSGVMLLNLRKMRQDSITEKLINYKMKNENYFMDQDAFNAVLSKNVLVLSGIYNFFSMDFMMMDFEKFNTKFYNGKYKNELDCLQDQKILHGLGRWKPWKYYVPVLTEKFCNYYKRSPYRKNELVLKSPISNITEELYQMISKMEWRFPYEKISKGSNIILYGAGDVGQSIYHQIDKTSYVNIVLWVDRKYEKLQRDVNVYPPDKILTCSFDYILVSIYSIETIKEIDAYFEKMKIPKKKIIYL